MPLSPTKIFLASHNLIPKHELEWFDPRLIVYGMNRVTVRRAVKFVWAPDESQLRFIEQHMSVEAHNDINLFDERWAQGRNRSESSP